MDSTILFKNKEFLKKELFVTAYLLSNQDKPKTDSQFVKLVVLFNIYLNDYEKQFKPEVNDDPASEYAAYISCLRLKEVLDDIVSDKTLKDLFGMLQSTSVFMGSMMGHGDEQTKSYVLQTLNMLI